MGFLAPLYIAGLLAISLPIIFHLLRRAPHGKQVFSSLMFLQQSPPRLTRRSRLTNIVLLIIRGLVLTLLALAFARPFFEWGSNLDKYQASGRRIALLMDTSASMQRGDLWKQAKEQAEKSLEGITPNDEVALYFFDGHVRPGMTFEEWNQAALLNRMTILRARLAEAKPGWGPTRLGEAVATVADVLTESAASRAGGAAGASTQPAIEDRLRREVVLISDLQQGGRAEALQGHQWPANVLLGVRPVALKSGGGGNASVQWVEQTPQADEGAGKGEERLRVRVNNEADSTHEQFTVAWGNERGPVAGVEPLKVYVAPGRSQIVRIAWPDVGAKADRLVLSGDESDFDNTLYIAPRRVEMVRVVYLGEDGAQDVNGLRYYLESALGDTAKRKIEWIAKGPGEALGDADLLGVRLVVVTGPVGDEVVERLRKYAEAGGGVMVVVKDQGMLVPAGKLMGVGALSAREVAGAGYSLIARVEMRHPLFAPFADARFGDFTKIHFWRHRSVQLPEGVRVLAAFDSGDPFLWEQTVGKGWVRVFSSGWQPADSQLALSTKFVPLMEGMLRRGDEALTTGQYVVGEAIALPAENAEASGRAIVSPKGERKALAAGVMTFEGDEPGIYRLVAAGGEAGAGGTLMAVNLSAEESRTAPLGVEDFERWGARLDKEAGMGEKEATEAVTRERRLKLAELENRQKVWRWLIVGVLGLLALEMLVSGRLAHRASNLRTAS